MATETKPRFLSEVVAGLLPYLRRYARALTGSQRTGDRYAAATLEALLTDRSAFEQGMSHKVALFHAFHMIWTSLGEPVGIDESGPARKAQAHLKRLTPNTREALLLHSIEDFSREEIALVMARELSEIDHLLSIAAQEMEAAITGKIMVIEDEAIIALDLQAIIAEMGHAITGVAATHRDAVRLARQERPDLILSDIQLADGSSGIEAVNEILAAAADIPVVFITAFPERLLTGERPEPTFLVTKPFNPDMVKALISQALFFDEGSRAAA